MKEAVAHPLTSRTYVAVAVARGVAAAYGHEDLADAHVALGVLREGENPAVAALQHAGVPLSALRRELEAALPRRGRPQRGVVALPATPGEAELMDRAVAEARRQGSEYVGTEHLLLALLRDEESQSARLFARHGFGVDEATRHLDAVSGRA